MSSISKKSGSSDSSSSCSESSVILKRRKSVRSKLQTRPKSKLEKPVSDSIQNISMRALIHKIEKFTNQYEKTMTRLELLLKEGFKATADCSLQIEKLRIDMNLPELEKEIGGLPSTALMKEEKATSQFNGPFHPDASDYSDSYDSGSESGDDDDDQDSFSSSEDSTSFRGKKRYRRGNGNYGRNKRFKSRHSFY